MTAKAEADVEALAAALRAAVPAATVLLTGSAARDELAEAVVADRHEVFSDYEFFVVTGGYVSVRQRHEIRARARRLAATFGYRNPLFHVDVGFRGRSRLHSMPRSVFTFELKRNACLMSGADVRTSLPEVDATTIDRAACNEIMLDAIWKLLHGIPTSFVRSRGAAADTLEELTVSYLLARSGLELTTVLLPRQGVLLPTYRERVAWVDEHGLEPWKAVDGATLKRFLRTCLDERRSLTFGATAAARYPECVRYMRRGLEVIGWRDAVTGRARSPFQERPASRGTWWVLARSLARIGRGHSVAAARRWARLPRKTMQAGGQLALLDALAASLRGDDDTAQAAVRHAWQSLALLLPGTAPAPPPLPLPEQWLVARSLFQEYWLRYCLLVQP